MYRNAYQRGLLTIFHSGGADPLNIWEVHTKDGYISRFLDQGIKSMVLEIGGTNVSTSYIVCPKGKAVLGITMPFLIMIVKNLKKYFSFEITILDETLTRRRFRVSNFQSTTQILPLCTAMPIGLSDGWNQIQFNLAEFTRRAYKKQYVEVQKLKINANIRIRRIYFAERILPEEQLPADYKLYVPLSSKRVKDKKTATPEVSDKENIKPSTSQQVVKSGGVAMEEKVKSETKIQRRSSKASIHSIKKKSSVASKKSSKINVEPISEGETPTLEYGPEKTAESEPGVDTQPAAQQNTGTDNDVKPEQVTDSSTGTPAEITVTPVDDNEVSAEAQATDILETNTTATAEVEAA